MATSTPNNTRVLPDDTEISIIAPQAESPVIISDDEVEEALRVLSNECHQQTHDVDVHEQSTLRLDTPNQSRSPRNSRSFSPELGSRDQNKKVNFDKRLEKQSKTSAPKEGKIISYESTVTVKIKSPRKQSLHLRPELVQPSGKQSKPPVTVDNKNTNNEKVHSISEKNVSPRKRKFQLSKQKNLKKQNEIPVAEETQPSSSNQSENTKPEESQSPRKQPKFQIFIQKSPVKEIETPAESPVIISDDEVEEALRVLSNECHQQTHDVDVHEQSTLRLDTPNQSRSPRNSRSFSPELGSRDQNKKVNFDKRLEKQSKTSAPKEGKIISYESTVTVKIKSPRKQSLHLRPELVQPSGKQSKPPVTVDNKNTNNEKVHSISEKNVSPRKRKFQLSKQKNLKKQNEIPVAEETQPSSSNQSENTKPEESQSPRKQPKFQIFIQKSPVKEIETPVAQESQTNNNQVDNRFPQNGPELKICESSISPCDCSIPGFSEIDIQKTPGVEVNRTTNEQYDNTIPRNSPLPKESQSSFSSCEFQFAEVSEKDIKLEHFPKKSLSISEHNEEVSSNECQSPCPCVEDELRNLLPATSKMSTLEKRQRWLISPDEIKKSLEAIRQSFVGKVEDNASKLFKALVYPPCTSANNNAENTSNLQTENFPCSSSNIRDISTSNFRKDIKIQVPPISNKCDYCDSNVEREKDEDGCCKNNGEAQSSAMTQITEDSPKSLNGLQLASADFNVQNKRKSNICPICDSSKDREDGYGCQDHHGHRKLEAQAPKKTDKSQSTDSQFFRDLDVPQTSKNNENLQGSCGICDPREECKEDDEGCYQKKNDLHNSEETQTKHRLSTLFKKKLASSDLNVHRTGTKSVNMQVPRGSRKCDFCETTQECEEVDGRRERNEEIQNPERSQKTLGELQALGDDSALESRKDPVGCENDPSTRPAEPRRILQVKIVKKELTEDSGGGSSCPGGCERYYRDKLMATLQILENKDETIRIQGSSLGVAEGRIAELSKRASALQAELEHKARELTKLRQLADSYRVDKSDVSIMAEAEDAEAQRHAVATLEDDLSVIAELYRECFYETAKQEELIELLRKSYLDVRLMEKDKTDKITRLQNVINTQRRSIEQCQDVVIEVESLKSEISSFLNSSNNDSGMWERGSESGDVGEELADILDQLRQLQDMLTGDCTCGLEEENRALKERNESLEHKVELLGQRNGELEDALRQILDQQFEKKIKEKERELQEAHKRLAEVENASKENGGSCETLTRQLQQAQVMLDDKSAELAGVQQTCAAQEASIRRLQDGLDRSEQLIQEGIKKLAEASQAREEQQRASQAAAAELELRLQRAAQRCRDLEMSCRDKQCSLEEAHARGARLCAESRRVTACVREWMRRKRQLAREQQEKIERQELMLRDLQRRVVAGQNMPELTSQSETDPSSSYSLRRGQITSDTSYPRCFRMNKSTCRSEITFSRGGPSLARCIDRERETTSCSKCESNRQFGSETASCSKCALDKESGSGTGRCAQAPVPPQRQKKKQQPGDELDGACPPRTPAPRPADARWLTLPRRAPPPRQLSPTDEVLARLDQLQAALDDGQRRWRRPRR